MKSFFVSLLLTLATAVVVLRGCNAPLSDEVLIKNLADKKRDYERLRDLFQADRSVDFVADWGIHIAGSAESVQPPVAELSLDRYHQYLALLQEIDGKA